jgi:hypothetical protein
LVPGHLGRDVRSREGRARHAELVRDDVGEDVDVCALDVDALVTVSAGPLQRGLEESRGEYP